MMRYEAAYCPWCRNRPGGCVYCPPKELIPETRAEQMVQYVMAEAAVYGICQVVETSVFRVPEPHPDRTPGGPNPKLERLFAERPARPLVRYDRAFAAWQVERLKRQRAKGFLLLVSLYDPQRRFDKGRRRRVAGIEKPGAVAQAVGACSRKENGRS